ncbi:hypothetical protein J4N45_14415 [Vibrio sp. SCSIO 43140]|uniref:hypothetical protein n=1 Tax=Vibrio sp. SCSIO 43140 TaxID=2819100 RepID=UPI002074B3ED|nr:hypothetical protein [Vibrio sp. SCSIO 43140]USD58817.1 hypothetical protein J4N45_09770 [Vibrio sp. SCSIO 43140]USD59151.1 hypothetical protein J4N45_11475 [Vibrio sp. SCSIO 43140]USD59696.1 hypothetical protein J4N45_14415 [Vibrio sp. SCSIO 43140]
MAEKHQKEGQDLRANYSQGYARALLNVIEMLEKPELWIVEVKSVLDDEVRDVNKYHFAEKSDAMNFITEKMTTAIACEHLYYVSPELDELQITLTGGRERYYSLKEGTLL